VRRASLSPADDRLSKHHIQTRIQTRRLTVPAVDVSVWTPRQSPYVVPYPKKRRARPKPSPVTIRHRNDDRGEVVSAKDFRARQDNRQVRATGLWWFVKRVNGPEQTITAQTLIFDQPRERDFPFAVVARQEPEDPDEADRYRRRLGLPMGEVPCRGILDIPAGSLSPRFRWVFDPYRHPCHGYANACVCPRCEARAWREEAA
jgi:hypothetical protein